MKQQCSKSNCHKSINSVILNLCIHFERLFHAPWISWYIVLCTYFQIGPFSVSLVNIHMHNIVKNCATFASFKCFCLILYTVIFFNNKTKMCLLFYLLSHSICPWNELCRGRNPLVCFLSLFLAKSIWILCCRFCTNYSMRITLCPKGPKWVK